jgi:hypothetical protein
MISMVCVVLSPFSIPHFIYLGHPSPLVSLVKGLPILFIFSKNELFVLFFYSLHVSCPWAAQLASLTADRAGFFLPLLLLLFSFMLPVQQRWARSLKRKSFLGPAVKTSVGQQRE